MKTKKKEKKAVEDKSGVGELLSSFFFNLLDNPRFLVCAAVLTKDKVLEFKYLTKDFPRHDILNTVNEFKRLAYKDVEGFPSEKHKV